MGKTYRDVADTGSCRHLATRFSQRESARAADELREAGFFASARLKQQATRHSLKFPNCNDDVSVAALDEVDGSWRDRVTVWHAGGGESKKVRVSCLYTYLENLRSKGITSVQVAWRDGHAIIAYRNRRHVGERWTIDNGTGSAPWWKLRRSLGQRTRYRSSRRGIDLTPLTSKPSKVSVLFLLHETRGRISIAGLEKSSPLVKAEELIGVVVEVKGAERTLSLSEMQRVFGTRTRKGYTYSFWYEKDDSRLRLHVN